MTKSDLLVDTYMSLRGQIARLVMGIVPPKEVEDIVQETYVRMCQVKSKDAIREPRSYLFRIAQNLALDHVKRAESRLSSSFDHGDGLQEQDFELSPDGDPTYTQVASDEEFVVFCEAVRSLPKQCRRAFILKKVYGYTLKEIMAEMNLGQPTVETHIINGTKKCVQFMREREQGEPLSKQGLPSIYSKNGFPLRRQGRRFMSTVLSISRDEEMLTAASRWVLRLDEGPLSADDQVALDRWLSEHARHRELLLEVAAVWDKTEVLARLSDIFPHETTACQVSRTPWYRQWPQTAAVAASLIVLLATALLLLPRLQVNPGSEPSLATQSAAYETAIGERKTVLLPDGSEVVLNTNSQLAVMFTPSARLLRLQRGEILVRVAKDPGRPLSVLANDSIIQAVGTEFRVEITDSQQVELLVTEGKVVVGVQPAALTAASAISRDADVLAAAARLSVLAQREDNTVSAGEEITLGATGTAKKTVPADDIEVKLSWQEGRLIFRSEPLETALREIERYTTVEFVLVDESLKSRTISGRFRAGDVETLLASLRANFNITHKFDENNRVLLSGI